MIFRKYFGSIKTRLIVNVIMIHAVLIGVFVYDMTRRESDFIHEQLSSKGRDVTSILASNAAQYLLNNDIVALGELITDTEKISDQYMVFILDQNGKVRASLPKRYFNLTLSDGISKGLIDEAKRTGQSVQRRHTDLIDTLYPVDVGGNVIGYARTILDSRKLNSEIEFINNRGILYIIIAILIGALFAWLSVRTMTRKLNDLTDAAHQIADHNFKVTLPESCQVDEVDTMIEAFHVMQSSLENHIRELDASQKRLNLALEGSSDGLWDWNLVSNEVYFSPRWKEMLGFEDHEIDNRFECWEEKLHPDDMERVVQFTESFLLSPEQRYEQKFRMRTKSGDHIPILARAKKVVDKEGKAVRLIGTHVDLSEITKIQERLQYQAQHDVLTSLPNRMLFMDRIEHEITRAERHTHKFAVLFLDLDHFKEINDSLGHDVGDQLLQKVSEILQNSVRKSDTISRLGGDEFAVILSDIDERGAVIEVVEKIMTNINIPHRIEENEFYTTLSIGIALYPDDGSEAQTLIKNADTAMYKAKKSGRNAYSFYTHDMTQKAIERMVVETALRNALIDGTLDVHYQPQVNIFTRELVGMEALVRWEHPDLGVMPPDLFIPLAEETGLITAVDIFVLKRVIADMNEWIEEGLDIVCAALNISVIELMHSNYFENFQQQLESCRCRPDQIEFEITESQIMKDPEVSISKLRYLSDIGVKLSVDDFGTGYSSLAYLKQLPIHKLKIDKSFVDDLAHDSDDREIVKTIIAMAKNLGLSVIAEGVEHQEQVDFLLGHGCEEIQGYYCYKPMTKEQITNLLREKRRLHESICIDERQG